MSGETTGALIEGGGKIIGGVAGGAGQIGANRAKRRGLRYIADQSDILATQANELGIKRLNELNALYDPAEFSDLVGLSGRMGTLANTDLSKYNVDLPPDFEFNMEKATQEEMNPYLNDIVDAAVGDVEASAAAGGTLLSGAAGKDIARSTYELRAKEYGAARDRARAQQQQKYQVYNDKFQRALQAAELARANVTGAFQMAQGAYNTQAGTRDTLSTQQQGIKNAADERKLQLQADAVAARGEAKSTPGGRSAFLQGFAGAF